MKKFLKWTGIVLVPLAVVLVLAFAFIYRKVNSRFDKTYDLAVEGVLVPGGAEAIALGKHMAAIKGCGDCHGNDYGGQTVIDDPGIGFLAAPNITTGKGGLLTRHRTYNDLDYVKAIKHGIGKDNKTLKLMPAYEYNPLSNKDLGALVAYLKSLPPVDNQPAPIKLNPLAYILTHFEQLPLVAAERVNHQSLSQDDVVPQVTASYGEYVAVSCTGCHRDNFQGGAALVPGSPAVPDISGAGSVGRWSEAQFIQTLRTGMTPDGRKLDPKFMPWKTTAAYTETEIKALYKFLRGFPSDTEGS